MLANHIRTVLEKLFIIFTVAPLIAVAVPHVVWLYPVHLFTSQLNNFIKDDWQIWRVSENQLARVSRLQIQTEPTNPLSGKRDVRWD